jgi:hypothetical protein
MTAIFLFQSCVAPNVWAQSLQMPSSVPSTKPAYIPASLQGLVLDYKEPFKLNFLVSPGQSPLSPVEKKEEYARLVRYFLAALAIPDNDQWVNLSPFEKERIISGNFGRTEMGRDLLRQDYQLKQLSSSLTHPDSATGKIFWEHLYAEFLRTFGTTQIPAEALNKVWIMPDKAVIHENSRTRSVHILEQRLKIVSDVDHAALRGGQPDRSPLEDIYQDALRKTILPLIEKEINESRDFAMLRQIYSSMLLAAWFKRALKDSVLTNLYGDKSKTTGIDTNPLVNQAIYRDYVDMFRKGVFDFIRDDLDTATGDILPRRYFSGGAVSVGSAFEDTVTVLTDQSQRIADPNEELVTASLVSPQQIPRRLAPTDIPVVLILLSLWQGHTNAPNKQVVIPFSPIYAQFLPEQNAIPGTRLLDDSPAAGLEIVDRHDLISWLVGLKNFKRAKKLAQIALRQRHELLALALSLPLSETLSDDQQTRVLTFSVNHRDYTVEIISHNKPFTYNGTDYDPLPGSMIKITKDRGHEILLEILKGETTPAQWKTDVVPFLLARVFPGIEVSGFDQPAETFELAASKDDMTSDDNTPSLNVTANTLEQIFSLPASKTELVSRKDALELAFMVETPEGKALLTALPLYAPEDKDRTFVVGLQVTVSTLTETGLHEILFANTHDLSLISRLNRENPSWRNFAVFASALVAGNPDTNSSPGSLAAAAPGGVDFSEAALDLLIKRDGSGIPLPVGQQNLTNIRINGLVPVIMNIRPAVEINW